MSKRPLPLSHYSFFALAFLTLVVSPLFAAKTLVRLEGLSPAQMQEYFRQGYDIAKTGKDYLEVVIDTSEAKAIKKSGTRVISVIPDLDDYVAKIRASETSEAKYYTYQTMLETLQGWVQKYPNICRLESIGKTFENRDIWALKISDNPQVDEKEPAVLIMGAHHAREWISTEVPMAAAKTLLEGYGKDERLTKLVNEREIWFVPMVNPDGVTYSQTVSRYWRKNRRKNADGSFGVDPNRNYGYKWATVGSSNSPSSDTYHGTGPFSEKETQAIRDLAAREKFSADITFHSYSELILYPWSWTNQQTCEHDAIFSKFAKEMAAFNHYTAEQSSELYPTGGDCDDYLYSAHKSLSFTFELATTFIPAPDQIAKICDQNVPAVLYLIEKAATYGLVTPSGQELVPYIDTQTAVEALKDLCPIASQNEAAASTLKKLQTELARRLVSDKAANRTTTAEALANLPSNLATIVKGILRDASQIEKFAELHKDYATR